MLAIFSEMVQVLSEMKTKKAAGHSDVLLELIAASEKVGIYVMV